MKKILKYTGRAEAKSNDGIAYECDYLHCVGLDIGLNKTIGDSLLFEETLTTEEEQYIKETLLFYVNLLNKNEERNSKFVNEVAEYHNVTLSYPGIEIYYENGKAVFSYKYKAGMIVPKRLLVFETWLEGVKCVGSCFHRIAGWADCVFEVKELKDRFKEIITKLVNEDIIEIIDCDKKVMDEIASFND